MNKRDFVWVGIRIFGIYLLVLAVLAVPPLINSTYMASQFSDSSTHETNDESSGGLFGNYHRTLFTNYVGNALGSALRLIVCAAAAWYFLRRGELVFRLASHPLGGEVDGPEAISRR